MLIYVLFIFIILPAGRVFRTCTVHAVRQENRQRRVDAPFRFSARDVRVENHLRKKNLNFAGYLTSRGA